MTRINHTARPSSDLYNGTIDAVNSVTGCITTLRGSSFASTGVLCVVTGFAGYLKDHIVCHNNVWHVKHRAINQGNRPKPENTLSPLTISQCYSDASKTRTYWPWSKSITYQDFIAGTLTEEAPLAIPGGSGNPSFWVFGTQSWLENPSAQYVTGDPDNWFYYGPMCGEGNYWLDNPVISVDSPGWAHSNATNVGLCRWWPLHQDWGGATPFIGYSGGSSSEYFDGAVYGHIHGNVQVFSPPWKLQMCDEGSQVLSAKAELWTSQATVTVEEWSYSPLLGLNRNISQQPAGFQILLMGAIPVGYDPFLGEIYRWVPLGASAPVAENTNEGTKVVDITHAMRALLYHRNTNNISHFGWIIGGLEGYINSQRAVPDALWAMAPKPTWSYDYEGDYWYPSSGRYMQVTYANFGFGKIWLEVRLPDSVLQQEPQYERWPRMD